jgi:hypothetical protein
MQKGEATKGNVTVVTVNLIRTRLCGWDDVRGGEDDQDVDLDALLPSPGDAPPRSSGNEHDAFPCRSGDASEAASCNPHCPSRRRVAFFPTNHLVQSASRWLRVAKRVLHPQDRDISSRQSGLTR